MKHIIFKRLIYCALVLTIIFGNVTKSSASHIIGADIFYSNISGLQYKLTLVLYGDCAGSAFPQLPTAQPQIQIYNNLTAFGAPVVLVLQAPTQGIEVTPVCPSQASNTTCVNPAGTVLGIKKFVYTANVTLNTTSTNWRFRFNGQMGSTSAGRTGAISNIVNPGNSIMALEATLNNTIAPANSSPTLSTIPTPFFCVNKPASYNPGAIDQNGDALVFSLIDALEAPPVGGVVSYVPPYSGAAPLPAVVSLNSSNGQLNFTPNLTGVFNVVNKIEEYRGATLVGTCMREMNFNITNCNNNPPGGNVTSSFGGNVLNSTSVNVCPSVGLFSFTINASDLDFNNINLTWAGLPAGAALNVVGNGTSSPIATFSWNVTNAAPGTYTIFITYQDDGCPLSSKQTVAYTIIVLPSPAITFTITQPATCTKKAKFNVALANGSPFDVTIGTLVHNGVTSSFNDSLAPGTYNISATNNNGCQKDTTITIAAPPPVAANYTITSPVCNNGTDGSISVAVTSGTAPYQYSFNGGPLTGVTSYPNLSSGTYTVRILDGYDCFKDTSITLLNPNPILMNVVTSKPPCNHFNNGSITVSAYNSIAPYQYALGANPYQGSGSFTNLFAGSYPIHIKNSVGCIKDTTIVIPDSIKVLANIAITNVDCNGAATGAVTITASGTFPPYTYAIGAGPFTSTNTFSNLTAGSYTLHVLDLDLCYLDTVITITEPTVLNATATVNSVACYGAASGTITVNATGGTPLYFYSVNGGAYQLGNVFNGLTAGTYNINVRDAHACIKSLSAVISQNPQIIPALTFTKPLCVGSADGTVTVTGSGGTPGFTYANGAGPYSGTTLFTGLTAGTYTFHIKDAANCIKDTIFTLANPPIIIPSVTMAIPTCTGDANGSITVVSTGGNPGYTYALGAGPYTASGTFGSLAAGTYTLHTKDNNNCIKDTTVTLQDAPPIHATVTIATPPCNHFNNGSITIAGTNSVAPYSYALGAGTYGPSGTFNSLFSGSYTIHIKNNLGCIKDTVVVVPDSVKIHGSAAVTQVLCNGDATGAVTISATGAYPGYTYAVGAGTFGASNVFGTLTAGTYTFHVLDTRLCYFDTTITITEPTAIVVTPTITHVLCHGAATGAISVAGTGGTGAYTYALNAGPFGLSNNFTNLTAGTYTVKIKDANSCIKPATAIITEPTAVGTGIVVDTPKCNAGTDGQVTLTGTGGVTPYLYAQGAGPYGVSGIFTTLSAGTYTFHIKDNNGCIKDTTITIGDHTPIIPTALVKKSTCSTLGDGKVTLSATGGVGPYQYANGAGPYSSTAVFTPLIANTYTFHIKDSKNCIKDTTITIVDSIFVHSTVTVTDADCFALNNGSFTVTGNNGFTPYTYALGTGTYSTTNTFSNLLANTYVLHIKDASGCIKDTNITVAQPTIIQPNALLTQPLCYGDANGIISIGAIGGTPGYTYALGTGTYQASGIFNTLLAGMYTFHVKDTKNCIRDTTVTLNQPTKVAYSALLVYNNKCFGDNSGKVDITATGGTPPYLYAFDATAYQASNTVTGMTAGTHTLHIKDANNCIRDSIVTLTQPAKLFLGVIVIQPTCEGFKDGVVSLAGIGGVSPYLFSSDNISFSTTSGFAGLPEGPYTYYVKDSNSCLHDTTFNLIGYPHIHYTVDVTDASCWGYKDGVITFNVTGGVPPYQYQQTNGTNPWQTVSTFDSLKRGNYSFEIKDSKNCVKDTTLAIDQPDKLVVTTTVTPNDCEGYDTEGGVRTDVVGGTLPYQYLWTNTPASTTPNITGMANGKYAVYVHDAHNCKDSSKVIVAYDNCCKPFIPNAFTPNGDGNNDKFRVRFKGDMTLQTFIITNRYGQVVFSTTDVTQGWDGVYNSTPQEVGTYFYYVKAICGNKGDNVVEYKGDLTLIR